MLIALIAVMGAVVLIGGVLLITGGDGDDSETDEASSQATPGASAGSQAGDDGGSTGAGPDEGPSGTGSEPGAETDAGSEGGGTGGGGAGSSDGGLSDEASAVLASATTPEDAVDMFINLGRGGDCANLILITTDAFFPGADDAERTAECESVVSQLQDITVTMEISGPAQVSGSTATVAVTAVPRGSTMSLVLEGDVWKVDSAAAD